MNNLRSEALRTPSVQAQLASIARYSRAGSYRAISSQARDKIPRIVSFRPSSTSLASPTPLRSHFFPSRLTVNFSAVSSRSFYYGPPLAKEHKDSKPEKTEPSAQSTKKPVEESETGEEAKEEKADEKTAGEEGEKKQKDEEKKKEDAPPPPPHGDKSPWEVFKETLEAGFKEKEFSEQTKALAGEVDKFAENERVRKLREAAASGSNIVADTTTKVLKSTAGAVGKGAAWTWETPAVKVARKSANATGKIVADVTRPIRESEGFKTVKNIIDDGSSSKYGGWVEKEERRKARERRELEENGGVAGKKKVEPATEDPNAGTNVTLHKDAAWKESWREFRDSSRLMQGLFSVKSAYNESENPLISTARNFSDRIAGFFAENETAMVIKKFREMDPSFQMEPFLRDMREYILPEVLDAYVKGDIETLRLWLSAAQFSVYDALSKQYTTAGLKSDGRILDIRAVDIMSARILEPGDIPVFIVTCKTQEVHVYRNAKTNELAAGMEDRVQQVTYAIGVTRIPEDVNNAETRGWRLIELQKSGRDFI